MFVGSLGILYSEVPSLWLLDVISSAFCPDCAFSALIYHLPLNYLSHLKISLLFKHCCIYIFRYSNENGSSIYTSPNSAMSNVTLFSLQNFHFWKTKVTHNEGKMHSLWKTFTVLNWMNIIICDLFKPDTMCVCRGGQARDLPVLDFWKIPKLEKRRKYKHIKY